jgi:hypothetical protein
MSETNNFDLQAWMDRVGLDEVRAAEVLGVSLESLCAKADGERPVSKQNVLLASFYEITTARWLEAEDIRRLLEVLRRPRKPD